MKLQPLNLSNLLDISVFLLLNFLAVAGRLSYDVEIKKVRFKLGSFINRFFITTIFTYITEIFIIRNERLRDYYTQIILFVAFFMMDIINLTLKYKDKIFVYVLSKLKGGIDDIITNMENKKKE